MNSIFNLFSKSFVFAGTTAIFILFMIFVLPGQSEKAATYTPADGSFDTSFFYSPDSVYDKIDSYGEEGRKAYIINRWTFDLVFPFVYGLFMLSGIAFSVKRFKGRIFSSHIWTRIAFIAVLFDLLENTFVTLAMVNFPQQYGFLAYCATISTLMKWVFVYTEMTLAILFPVVLGMQKLIETVKSTRQ